MWNWGSFCQDHKCGVQTDKFAERYIWTLGDFTTRGMFENVLKAYRKRTKVTKGTNPLIPIYTPVSEARPTSGSLPGTCWSPSSGELGDTNVLAVFAFLPSRVGLSYSPDHICPSASPSSPSFFILVSLSHTPSVLGSSQRSFLSLHVPFTSSLLAYYSLGFSLNVLNVAVSGPSWFLVRLIGPQPRDRKRHALVVIPAEEALPRATLPLLKAVEKKKSPTPGPA